MLCSHRSVTQRHHFSNRSQPWAEVPVALSGLVNNVGQSSLSGLEGKQHSRTHIYTTELSSLSIHPWSTPCPVVSSEPWPGAAASYGSQSHNRDVDGLTTELTTQI